MFMLVLGVIVVAACCSCSGSYGCCHCCSDDGWIPKPLHICHTSPCSVALYAFSHLMFSIHSCSWMPCMGNVWPMLFLASSQPSSLSAKLNELASRRAAWLSSVTIGYRQQHNSCCSLETIIGGSETGRDGSAEKNNTSLQRSASSSCLSSPVVESVTDVSVL